MKTRITIAPFVRVELKDDPTERPWSFEREIVSDREVERDTPSCYEKIVARLWAVDSHGMAWYDAKDYRHLRSAAQREYLSKLTVDEMWERLKTVTPMSLKKAVAAILWWDLVSDHNCAQFRAMKKANRHMDEFCAFATYPDKVGAMDKWVLTIDGCGRCNKNGTAFSEALMKFGYFRECAEKRVNYSDETFRAEVRKFRALENEIKAAQKVTLNALKKAKDIEAKARERAARIEAKARERAEKIEARAMEDAE